MATFCFDMYGTLCDTASVRAAVGEALDVPGTMAAELDATWRRKQLQYSYLTALMGAYRPFREVTRDALRYALDQYDVETDAETRGALLDAYDRLDPYPDAAGTLRRLRSAGHTAVVLSNGNPGMLRRLADNTGLAGHLDGLCSAHSAGAFKPAPAVYETAADELGVPLREATLVSGNAWDVAGAGHAGMRTAWIDRSRAPTERIGPAPDATYRSLSGVADDHA
jgi:2-haloacid dehalogenase